MEKELHDVIIIGKGPAGLQAAIHAARRKVSTLSLDLNRSKRIVLVLCTIQVFLSGLGGDFNGKMGENLFAATSGQFSAVQAEKKPDIQWFKEEMKISPKYQEKREGVLGMSWNHFLTMAFLVVFFFGAFLVYHLRTVRTRQILERLLKEEEDKNGT